MRPKHRNREPPSALLLQSHPMEELVKLKKKLCSSPSSSSPSPSPSPSASPSSLLVLLLTLTIMLDTNNNAAITLARGALLNSNSSSSSNNNISIDAETMSLQRFLEASLGNSMSLYNFSAHVCTWKGVRCNREENSIESLLLESMGLQGSIQPQTLGSLRSLTHLSLYNNSLHCPIPWDLWSLTSLHYLSLSLNSFNGSIPSSHLSNLRDLERLDLSHNQFSGGFPASLPTLPRLRFLFLSSNQLSGNLPASLFSSQSLLFVDASRNRLFGPIPDRIDPANNLISLNLSANSLSGPLPATTFPNLARLSVLDLSQNMLSGPLSPLASLPKLDRLILSVNHFMGPVPTFRSNNTLRVLRLRNNLLSGPIPPSLLLSSPRLIELDLSTNVLSADISSFMNNSAPTSSSSSSSSSPLTWLDLSSNNVSGDFSMVGFDAFPSLVYLDLSGNHVSGSLPGSLVAARNLSHLDLSDNALDGDVSPLGQMPRLEFLDLHNNSLNGSVAALSNLTSLSRLNLSYNPDLGCDRDLLTRFGSDSFAGINDCEPLPAEIGDNFRAMHHHHAGSPMNPRQSRRRALIVGVIVAASIASLMCVLLLAAFVLWKRRQRWPVSALSLKRPATFNKDSADSRYMSGPFSFESNSGPWVANVRNAASVPVVMFEKPLLNLTFADLLRATSNFNKETQVSQGGLGPVYSATLGVDLRVSIKVLIEGRVLTNEVAASHFATLSKIKHPNLVPLLGYCIVGEERLVIYEYMKNGGLHRWLLGTPDRSQELVGTPPPPTSNAHIDDVSTDLATRARLEPLPEAVNLSWPVRHKIALGLARALAFLHHGQSTKMVHRDVKSSNVMLDGDFEPHLANTGLAGLLAGTEDAAYARGSPGYAPPEYGQPGGEVSIMGDVFSYGVVLLELVTGKKPTGDMYDDETQQRGGFESQHSANDLVSWVRMRMQEKSPRLLVGTLDQRVCKDQYSREQMLEGLRIGYLCTAESPTKRPTIQQVVGLLKDMAPNVTSP